MKRKGFTLLELLIVVIIIGILAGLAVPQFFRVAEKARSAEGVSVIGALRQAQLRYYSLHAVFTNAIAELDVDIPAALKYFTPAALVPAAAGDPIAQATRNAFEYTGAAAYVVDIDADGNIACTGDAVMCAKLGF